MSCTDRDCDRRLGRCWEACPTGTRRSCRTWPWNCAKSAATLCVPLFSRTSKPGPMHFSWLSLQAPCLPQGVEQLSFVMLFLLEAFEGCTHRTEELSTQMRGVIGVRNSYAVAWRSMCSTSRAWRVSSSQSCSSLSCLHSGTKSLSCVQFLCRGLEDHVFYQQSMAGQQLSEVQQLVQASGKMVLMDKLLPKLRAEGHKVRIACQQSETYRLKCHCRSRFSTLPQSCQMWCRSKGISWGENHISFRACFSASVKPCWTS
jgi:hypothetical protein